MALLHLSYPREPLWGGCWARVLTRAAVTVLLQKRGPGTHQNVADGASCYSYPALQTDFCLPPPTSLSLSINTNNRFRRVRRRKERKSTEALKQPFLKEQPQTEVDWAQGQCLGLRPL